MEIFWRTIAYYNSATWLFADSYYSYWYRADSIAHLGHVRG